MTKYSDLLRDPRWQKMRLQILDRDEWTCQRCGSPDKTLHVHHCYYQKDKMPWEYPAGSLVTLCFECHDDETAAMGSYWLRDDDNNPLLHQLLQLGLTLGDIESLCVSLWDWEKHHTGRPRDIISILIDAIGAATHG